MELTQPYVFSISFVNKLQSSGGAMASLDRGDAWFHYLYKINPKDIVRTAINVINLVQARDTTW